MSAEDGPTSKSRVLFRRSPHLISYWSPGGLVLENYATGRRGGGAPRVHDILGVFDRWRPVDALRRALPGTPRSTLTRIVDALVGLTFLQRSDRPPLPAETALSTWRGWNPAAAFFHRSTRDVKFATDIEASVRRKRALARRNPLPPAVKRYRGLPRIKWRWRGWTPNFRGRCWGAEHGANFRRVRRLSRRSALRSV